MRALLASLALLGALGWLPMPLRAEPYEVGGEQTQTASDQAPPPEKSSLLKGEEVGVRISSGFAKGFDAIILRPIAALKAGGGLALFVPAAVMAVPEGKDARQEAWDILVATPSRDAFERPLGDF